MKKRPQSGFTIVELIIVITVIGILASIIYVSLTGVQTNAASQSAKAAAVVVQRKIEEYDQDNNGYPTALTASDYVQALAGAGDSSLANTGLTLGTPDSTNGKTTVEISQCTGIPGTYYRLRYYDFNLQSLSSNVITGSLGAQDCPGGWTVLS